MDVNMMKLIFIRHGEPDYSAIKKAYSFWSIENGKNYACLTLNGIKQAQCVAQDQRLKDAQLIISSPYTRALQTAGIIAQNINVPLFVEIGLREWMSECSVQFNSIEDFQSMMDEFVAHKGQYDSTCKFQWESLDKLNERISQVILKYSDYKKIIIVSHKMVFSQFCNTNNMPYCGIYEKNIDIGALTSKYSSNE
jgi:broad specificity phosphatase PhoE